MIGLLEDSLVNDQGYVNGKWLVVQKLQRHGAPHVLLAMEVTKKTSTNMKIGCTLKQKGHAKF